MFEKFRFQKCAKLGRRRGRVKFAHIPRTERGHRPIFFLQVALRAVFNELSDGYINSCFMAADYLGDAILLCDIFVHMISSHLSDDLLVVDEPRKLVAYWWAQRTGKWDVLAVIPSDLTFIWTGMNNPFPVVRFNRYFKYYRLQEWLSQTEALVWDPQIFRLISVVSI